MVGVQFEGRLVVLDRDHDLAALGELAEQQLVGERPLDLVLDDAASGRAPLSGS